MNKTNLLLDVVKGIGGINGEADQDDVRVRIRKRSETIVIFLTSRIPQCQLDMFSIDFDIGNIVFEHGRYVDLRY